MVNNLFHKFSLNTFAVSRKDIYIIWEKKMNKPCRNYDKIGPKEE